MLWGEHWITGQHIRNNNNDAKIIHEAMPIIAMNIGNTTIEVKYSFVFEKSCVDDWNDEVKWGTRWTANTLALGEYDDIPTSVEYTCDQLISKQDTHIIDIIASIEWPYQYVNYK